MIFGACDTISFNPVIDALRAPPQLRPSFRSNLNSSIHLHFKRRYPQEMTPNTCRLNLLPLKLTSVPSKHANRSFSFSQLIRHDVALKMSNEACVVRKLLFDLLRVEFSSAPAVTSAQASQGAVVVERCDLTSRSAEGQIRNGDPLSRRRVCLGVCCGWIVWTWI